MSEANLIIAENILTILKTQNKKYTELAEAMHINESDVRSMLNGSRMINAIELKQIADFLGVKNEKLTQTPDINITSSIDALMMKVKTEQARKALATADKLSDMILFHKKVRENGSKMMEKFDF